MGGRYLITGADLGTLIALSKVGKFHLLHQKLNEIENKRFVGQSGTPINKDLKKIEKVFMDGILFKKV